MGDLGFWVHEQNLGVWQCWLGGGCGEERLLPVSHAGWSGHQRGLAVIFGVRRGVQWYTEEILLPWCLLIQSHGFFSLDTVLPWQLLYKLLLVNSEYHLPGVGAWWREPGFLLIDRKTISFSQGLAGQMAELGFYLKSIMTLLIPTPPWQGRGSPARSKCWLHSFFREIFYLCSLGIKGK